MKIKEHFIFPAVFLLVAGIFFYKSIVYGYVPFPGDLLVSEYNPWKSDSFLGYNPGSYPNKAQYFDTLRQIYPWKTFVINSFKNSSLPLWNPYNFSGAPLLANIQSAVFYPFNILYFFVGQKLGWLMLVILEPLLASIFMYAFCRQIKLSIFGAFVSSIAFSYSLFMSVFLEYNTFFHVILWLPLILYVFEKLIIRVNVFYLLLFVAGIVFSLLGGHLQLSVLVFGFVVVYIFFRLLNSKNIKKIRYSILFICLLTLGLGISGIQLLPTFELIQFSSRVPQSYEFLRSSLLIQPYQLILFLIPDLFGNPATRNYLIQDTYPGNAVYIGLVSFVFALFSLRLIRRNYFVCFFFIISIILLLFLVRSPFSDFFYRFNIPLFSTSSPTNAIFLLSFSMSILAGFGIGSWQKTNKKLFPLIILTITGIFIVIWLFVLINGGKISMRNLLYSTIIFSIFGAIFLIGTFVQNRKNVSAILLIGITLFDLFYFFQKFNPFVPSQLIFPSTHITTWLRNNAGVNRVWGYAAAAIEANFATEYSFFSPDGYDPLYPKSYGEFIQASRDGKINTTFTNFSRSDAVIAPGFGETDLAMNESRLKVLDLLGVKYILDRKENASSQKTFPLDRFLLVFKNDGWRVFENKKALPRAFLVSKYEIAKTSQEFEKIFFAKNFDPSKTIILEEDLNLPAGKAGHQSSIHTVSYTPNKVTFKTNADGARLLFLSDTYFLGWKAYVDTHETKVYKANYSFRAILVPSGSHKITYVYEPESFSLGIKITIISIALLIIVLFTSKKSFNHEA